MLEERLINLETKFSHQEVLIEELQKTLHEQYLIIQKLEKTLELIKDRLKAEIYKNPASNALAERPPHY